MSKPLFATIPFLGEEYTISYQAEGITENETLKGYGELPADYQNIPVIDFRDNNKVFDAIRLDLYPIEVYGKRRGNCTLKEMFSKLKEIGIKITG